MISACILPDYVKIDSATQTRISRGLCAHPYQKPHRVRKGVRPPGSRETAVVERVERNTRLKRNSNGTPIWPDAFRRMEEDSQGRQDYIDPSEGTVSYLEAVGSIVKAVIRDRRYRALREGSRSCQGDLLAIVYLQCQLGALIATRS